MSSSDSGAVSPVPEHLHTVTPRLVVSDGAAAIAFYNRAFGAEEIGDRFTGPGGEVIHAEIRIGDSVVMITEDAVDGPVSSPQRLGGAVTCVLSLYWPDVDAAWERAVAAGAEVMYPLEDQFYGERGGRLRDPGQQPTTLLIRRTGQPCVWNGSMSCPASSSGPGAAESSCSTGTGRPFRPVRPTAPLEEGNLAQPIRTSQRRKWPAGHRPTFPADSPRSQAGTRRGLW